MLLAAQLDQNIRDPSIFTSVNNIQTLLEYQNNICVDYR